MKAVVLLSFLIRDRSMALRSVCVCGGGGGGERERERDKMTVLTDLHGHTCVCLCLCAWSARKPTHYTCSCFKCNCR